MYSNKKDFLCSYLRENQGDLYKFAYSYVKDREDALDVVQDAVLKALEAVDSLKNVESIKPWIFKIIVNEANAMFRRRKRFVCMEKDEEEYHEDEYSDEISEYVSRQDMLKRVFKLHKKYRMVIVLRYYEEMKLSEIATVLGISENTVKTRLYKALKMLKKEMEEDKCYEYL